MDRVKSDKAVCPRCHVWMVYSEHVVFGDLWRIHCKHCGLTSKVCKSYEAAMKDWDQYEEEFNHDKKRNQ